MTTPSPLLMVSLHNQVSLVEWQTQVDPAACYRLVADSAVHWL